MAATRKPGWRMLAHQPFSDIHDGPERPGHTLWPHGAQIAGLSRDEARLVEAAPRLLASLRRVVGVMAAGTVSQQQRALVEAYNLVKFAEKRVWPYVVVGREGWRLEWVNLPDEVDDETGAPLLRAELSWRPGRGQDAGGVVGAEDGPDKDGFVGVARGSYCTNATVETPTEELAWASHELFMELERCGTKGRPYCRGAMERWTWRSYTGTRAADRDSWKRGSRGPARRGRGK